MSSLSVNHPVIRALLRRTWNAYREVHVLDYGSSRKRLAAEVENLANRLEISNDEALMLVVAFGQGESK
jgi:hypothetical protein